LVLPWLVALLAVALVTLTGCAPLAGVTFANEVAAPGAQGSS
jgi:hypothetical protein